MKKFGAILTVILFVATTSVANAQLISPSDEPIPLYQNTSYFGLFEQDDYKPALDWMFENDVMTGYGDTGELGEKECVKRAEILKMLFKVRGINANISTAELFADTPEGEWYVPYVRTARDRGTIQGYEDGTFKPGQCVNRAEAIKIATLEFNNGTLPSYDTLATTLADVTSDQWFYNHINYAVSSDIVGLNHASYVMYPSLNYYPGDSMTREEVAEMLYRLKTMKDKGLSSFDEAYGPRDALAVPLQSYEVSLEEFFSETTSFLVSVDTSDTSQVYNMNKLLGYFPSGDLNGLVEEFMADLDSGLAEANLTYADDLEPLFGTGFKVMLGTTTSLYSGFEGQLAITIQDKDELNELVDALDKLDGFTKANILGFNTLTNEKEGLYMTYTDNALFISNSVKSRYTALTRIKEGLNTLADNTDYIYYKSSLPTPRLGMIFMDYNSFYGMSGIMSPVENSAYAIVATTSGIKMYEQVIGYRIPQHTPYMYKNIPDGDLIMYAEAYGLVDMYEEMGMSPADFFTEAGVDTPDMEWMNAGYAMVFYNTDSLIPGMSFYFDASKDLVAAQDVINQLDEVFNQMMAELDSEDAPEELKRMITKDTVWIDSRQFNRLAVHFDALTEEERAAEGLDSAFFDEPIEFYYGMTSDNYVLFSLYSGLDDMYKSAATVETNAQLREARNYVSDYPYALSYISVPETIAYIDTLIAVMEAEEGAMPDDEREAYELVKDYLAPIKYMVGANDDWELGAAGLMFMKISN